MKRLFYFILLILVFSACEQYPTPGTHVLKQLNFQIVGADQSAEAGNYLPDSVGIFVDFASLVPAGERNFAMELEVLEGGGTVDQTVVYVNKNGIMKTRWKVGNSSNTQILKVKIYDTDGLFNYETQVSATSFIPGQWNTITKGYLTKIHDMAVDTVNNRTLMLAGCNLFERQDKFHNWEKLPDESNPCLSHIEINSQGKLFAGKSDGTLYKSEDWGVQWENLGKPIPDNDFTFRLNVTPDDYIWVSRWEHGIYCSTDGGLTWQKNVTGLVIDEEMNDVYMLSDGSHLSLSLNQLEILRTFDAGINWSPINTPIYSLCFFVTEKDEIIAFNQENGFSIYKSTDFGESFKRVYSAQTSYHTTPMTNIFKKYKDTYYFVAPGSGVFKTKDFESFEKILSEDEVRHLHIDHTGTLYVNGFMQEPVYILPN